MNSRERSMLVLAGVVVLAVVGGVFAVGAFRGDNDELATDANPVSTSSTSSSTSTSLPPSTMTGDLVGQAARNDDGLPTLSEERTPVTPLARPGAPAPSAAPEPEPATTSTTNEPAENALAGTSSSSLPDGETTSTAANDPTSTTAADTTTTVAAPTGMNPVEMEILRLTNQLRANPAGPLARVKPMPSCVGDGFYQIQIDPATGHPTAVGSLTLDERVSASLARDWSQTMDRTGNFEHRTSDSAAAVYSELGINWASTGENIAFFAGYPDSQAATVFFEGWRESDTGHYCALVAGRYSHIGIGYYKGAQRSWATQNFYEPR
ncbi:MAG: CAP domain-containing protein [Actinomycetota bacterium]